MNTEPSNILQLPGGDVPILGSTKQIDMDVIVQALDALGNAFSHLQAVDVSNAHANCAEPRWRPLTVKVAEAAGKLAEAAGMVVEDGD